MFWILVVLVGLSGAVADVILQQWSRTQLLAPWLYSAAGYLVFMTGLGLVIRFGEMGKFPLTIAVLLVVVVNIASLAIWDSYKGVSFPAMQWVGMILCVAGVACLEFGRA
jgi:hypothetical protein